MPFCLIPSVHINYRVNLDLLMTVDWRPLIYDLTWLLRLRLGSCVERKYLDMRSAPALRV
ncbi:MAG: hypothetical protein C0510_07610 [Erythrobacter sp.]|nr:hypothetical protein [Erythrobacter sp.]